MSFPQIVDRRQPTITISDVKHHSFLFTGNGWWKKCDGSRVVLSCPRDGFYSTESHESRTGFLIYKDEGEQTFRICDVANQAFLFVDDDVGKQGRHNVYARSDYDFKSTKDFKLRTAFHISCENGKYKIRDVKHNFYLFVGMNESFDVHRVYACNESKIHSIRARIFFNLQLGEPTIYNLYHSTPLTINQINPQNSPINLPMPNPTTSQDRPINSTHPNPQPQNSLGPVLPNPIVDRSVIEVMKFLRNPEDTSITPSLRENLIKGVIDKEVLMSVISEIGRLNDQEEQIKQEKAKMVQNCNSFLKARYKEALDEIATRQSTNTGPDNVTIIQEKLKKRVIGQDTTIKLLSCTLVEQMETTSQNKVCLFVGPSGIGKTELAKAVSEIKGNNRYIYRNMETYESEHSVNDFFGSPQGYLGSSDRSAFARDLQRCQPLCVGTEGDLFKYEVRDTVILFDEFEKTHSKFKTSFLGLFDEWTYRNCYTNKTETFYKNITEEYKFINCVIICTSNLFKEEVLQEFNGGLSHLQIAGLFKLWNDKCLKKPAFPSFHQLFPTELINRMKVLPFGPIPKGECFQAVIKLQLGIFIKNLTEQYKYKEIVFEPESEVLSILEQKIYIDGTNLRAIKDELSNIGNKITEHKSNWGPLENLKNIKLVVYPVDGILHLQAYMLVSNVEYIEWKTPIILF